MIPAMHDEPRDREIAAELGQTFAVGREVPVNFTMTLDERQAEYVARIDREVRQEIKQRHPETIDKALRKATADVRKINRSLPKHLKKSAKPKALRRSILDTVVRMGRRMPVGA